MYHTNKGSCTAVLDKADYDKTVSDTKAYELLGNIPRIVLDRQ